MPLHVGAPFCTEQTLPQMPHALTLFVVATSQPFAKFASQLPKSAAQLIPHAPAEQVGEPLFELQAFMHAPQCEVLVAVLTSHPFALLPSQLANVPVHDEISHVPVAHETFELDKLHAVPHEPQFESVFRFVSQPFEYKPSQSAKPVLHEATTHVPPPQAGVPLATKQVMPQPPQWLMSLVVVVSQPLAVLPSQSPLPAWQLDTPHTLLMHAGVPP